MILHSSLQLLKQSIDQSLNPQKTYFVRIWGKIDRIITAPHIIKCDVTFIEPMHCNQPYIADLSQLRLSFKACGNTVGCYYTRLTGPVWRLI